MRRNMQAGGDGRIADVSLLAGTSRTTHDGDHGLALHRDATSAYTRLLEELLAERTINMTFERKAATLAAANAALERSAVGLRAREATLRTQITQMERHSTSQDHRFSRLLSSIRRMHRALFAGTTWEHILRAAMELTKAERGYYVGDEPRGLRIHAVVDVPASAGQIPSPFISGIVRRVLDTGDAVRWTRDLPPDGLIPAANERFREGIAVPVSVNGAPRAVIITLDKDGVFHDDEVHSLLRVGTEAGIAVENEHLRESLNGAYISTIALLADSVEAKDPYTKGHCEQVSLYARLAAERLSLTDEQKRIACYAALLHDVGKIGVSDGVLNKPGPLIAEERKLVEAHVRIGHDLLSSIPALREVASAVLYHHERYDGNGYPEGLAGDSIPIASRIVAVVDAYCAMLDKRSYKEAYPPERARAELLRCAGTQFDPVIVQVVVEAIDEIDAAERDGVLLSDMGCGILPPSAVTSPSRGQKTA